jgi:hypothetical protein
VGKPEGKRSLGRPRCSWVDNIEMDLLEICWGGVDWIGLAKDSELVKRSCECSNEALGSIKCEYYLYLIVYTAGCNKIWRKYGRCELVTFPDMVMSAIICVLTLL